MGRRPRRCGDGCGACEAEPALKVGVPCSTTWRRARPWPRLLAGLVASAVGDGGRRVDSAQYEVVPAGVEL